MNGKYVLLALIGLALFVTGAGVVPAQGVVDTNVQKVKSEIDRLGKGQTGMVEVKLNDGTKLKGYISQILEDSFDLTDPKTRRPTTIPYRDVAKVKRKGTRGMKTAIGIATAAGIVVLILTLPRSRPLGTICPLGCGPF